MDRDRWQALQAHLKAARAALKAGDRAAALVEVDAALAIDPEFTAARLLREQIGDGSAEAVSPPPACDVVVAPREPQPRPLFSAEGFARFEERARQRRFERRVDAAHEAVRRGRFGEARAAIAELRELDASAPEVASLSAALESARRSRAGLWIRTSPYAAAVALPVLIFGAAQLKDSRPLASHPTALAAPLVAPPPPARLTPASSHPAATPAPAPVGTAGRGVTAAQTAPSPTSDPAARPSPSPAIDDAQDAPPSAGGDDRLVWQALQRFRSAHEGIDSDGLEVQRLTFDSCDVRLRDDVALASCRGNAQYVAPAGSREPRTEARVWTFTLRKSGSDWTIESARADR